MIDLEQIRPGDEIVIKDDNGNFAIGKTALDKGAMVINIFGSRLPVATLNRDGHWQHKGGVKIVRHQPGLFEPVDQVRRRRNIPGAA